MHLETVLSQMRSMRLSSMADAFSSRLAAGDHNGLSHEEFVSLLINDEWQARENRKLSLMLSRTNFKPEQACLENIKYDDIRGFKKMDIMEFRTETWVQNTRNVILTGATGSGKTFIAEAIGLQACRLGFGAVKKRFRILFEEIREAKGVGTYLKYLKQIEKTKVLIIDDFLMDDMLTAADLNDLMDLIELREQTGSIIVTTQYPVAKWHERMPDPTIADAICDRLINNAAVFNLKGESMRKTKTN